MFKGEEDRIRALIIDDEVDVCYLLTEILKRKNIKASYVNSLTEAKMILERFTPSLIFLDNHLPDGLGVDFVKYIKSICPAASILVITAQEKSFYKEKALMNGAIDFIGKPFTKEIIFTAIDNISHLAENGECVANE